MNELMTIQNVRCYLDENGVAHLNLEDVARGLGFTEIKNNKEYVMWRRVYGYLSEFGFSAQVPKGETSPFAGKEGPPDYIPENIFFKLCFKASNETARKFQDIVTDEVLPSIRRHGAYLTPGTLENMIASPEFGIKLLTALKDEQKKNKKLSIEIDHKD